MKQATSHAQIIRPQSPKTRVRDFAASDVGNDSRTGLGIDWAEFVAPLEDQWIILIVSLGCKMIQDDTSIISHGTGSPLVSIQLACARPSGFANESQHQYIDI